MTNRLSTVPHQANLQASLNDYLPVITLLFVCHQEASRIASIISEAKLGVAVALEKGPFKEKMK